MDIDDIYGDLDTFQATEDKKNKELQALQAQYDESLTTIETLKTENAELQKKIKTMQVNFQNLLDTAKAEIKRKDQLITQLRNEKDAICFRRRAPNGEQSQQQQHNKNRQAADQQRATYTDHNGGEKVDYGSGHRDKEPPHAAHSKEDQLYYKKQEKTESESYKHNAGDKRRDKEDEKQGKRHRRDSERSEEKSSKSNYSDSRNHDKHERVESYKREERKDNRSYNVKKQKDYTSTSSEQESNERHERDRKYDKPADYRERDNSKRDRRFEERKYYENRNESKQKEQEKHIDRNSDRRSTEEHKVHKDENRHKTPSSSKADLTLDYMKDLVMDETTHVVHSLENENTSKKVEDYKKSPKNESYNPETVDQPCDMSLENNNISENVKITTSQHPLTLPNELHTTNYGHVTPLKSIIDLTSADPTPQNTPHESNSLQPSLKNVETPNFARFLQEFNTPKKAALFDQLFGQTPSSVESVSSSLLTNVVSLLDQNNYRSASAVTTPSTGSEKIAVESHQKLDNLSSKEVEQYFHPNESGTIEQRTNAIKNLTAVEYITGLSGDMPRMRRAQYGFSTRPNEIIEIEDDTDIEKTDEEPQFVEVGEKVAELPEKRGTGHNKNDIVILENIRLPVNFEMEAKKNAELNGEEIADDRKGANEDNRPEDKEQTTNVSANLLHEKEEIEELKENMALSDSKIVKSPTESPSKTNLNEKAERVADVEPKCQHLPVEELNEPMNATNDNGEAECQQPPVEELNASEKFLNTTSSKTEEDHKDNKSAELKLEAVVEHTEEEELKQNDLTAEAQNNDKHQKLSADELMKPGIDHKAINICTETSTATGEREQAEISNLAATESAIVSPDEEQNVDQKIESDKQEVLERTNAIQHNETDKEEGEISDDNLDDISEEELEIELLEESTQNKVKDRPIESISKAPVEAKPLDSQSLVNEYMSPAASKDVSLKSRSHAKANITSCDIRLRNQQEHGTDSLDENQTESRAVDCHKSEINDVTNGKRKLRNRKDTCDQTGTSHNEMEIEVTNIENNVVSHKETVEEETAMETKSSIIDRKSRASKYTKQKTLNKIEHKSPKKSLKRTEKCSKEKPMGTMDIKNLSTAAPITVKEPVIAKTEVRVDIDHAKKTVNCLEVTNWKLKDQGLQAIKKFKIPKVKKADSKKEVTRSNGRTEQGPTDVDAVEDTDQTQVEARDKAKNDGMLQYQEFVADTNRKTVANGSSKSKRKRSSIEDGEKIEDCGVKTTKLRKVDDDNHAISKEKTKGKAKMTKVEDEHEKEERPEVQHNNETAEEMSTKGEEQKKSIEDGTPLVLAPNETTTPLVDLCKELTSNFNHLNKILNVPDAATTRVLNTLLSEASFESNLPADTTQPSFMSPLCSANGSQDERYREIDNRLQSMFASPAHIVEASTPNTSLLHDKDDFNVPDTFIAEMSNNSNQETNVTIDETTGLEPTNSNNLDESLSSSLNDSNNSVCTKNISLGSSDYRFEKESDNVIKLFITRKRRAKKPKVAIN